MKRPIDRPMTSASERTRHDFRNNLAVILGFADLMLADAPADHPYRSGLEEIREAAKAALDQLAADPPTEGTSGGGA